MRSRVKKSLSEKVYNRLLKDIVSGKIPSGEKLGEEAISVKLKVSRTPVREAIHRLTQEGIIERIPRRGCFVKNQDKNEIREIFDCRQLMECHALEQGFDHIPKKRLEAMKSHIDKFEHVKASEQTKISLELDELLHDLVTEICPNLLMKDMILKLRRQSNPFRTFRSLNEDEIASIMAERVSIFTAIATGDKAKAVKLLKKHILAGEEIL